MSIECIGEAFHGRYASNTYSSFAASVGHGRNDLLKELGLFNGEREKGSASDEFLVGQGVVRGSVVFHQVLEPVCRELWVDIQAVNLFGYLFISSNKCSSVNYVSVIIMF